MALYLKADNRAGPAIVAILGIRCLWLVAEQILIRPFNPFIIDANVAG